jgi:small subunit ribosomal protein S1
MEHSNEKKIENDEQQSFSEMLNDYGFQSFDTTKPIEGHIVDFIDDRVIIDIGSKTEGILAKSELIGWNGELQYKIGDVIKVLYKKKNLKEGYIVVSKDEYDKVLGWENIKNAFQKDLQIIGRIINKLDNNKGFMVDFGVEMFLPLSQVDIKKVSDDKKYIGKEYWFKVLKLDERRQSGVVSRRKVLEEKEQIELVKLLADLKLGDELQGRVVSILDYGIFIDIGGINGFLHKNDMSYGRIGHPREKFRKGDDIKVKVIDIDKKEKKITLGYKQRFNDPWKNIETKYPVGKRMMAKVTKILSFGAFIELEEGVEGLLHISDLTWEGKPDTVEDYVAVGDKLWIQVIGMNAEEKKIKLGLKQLENRPEEKYMEEHAVGDIVRAKVRKILKTIVFLELEENIEGIIKISDIKYFRIDSPAEFMEEGQEIDVMILSRELDKNYKIRLGLKQLEDKAWAEFFKKNKNGSVVKVKVKAIQENGIKVQVTDEIEGFIRIGEISTNRIEPGDIGKEISEGEEREALIVSTNPERKRINLSFKALVNRKEREDIEKFMKADESKSITTIGDLLQTEMDKIK